MQHVEHWVYNNKKKEAQEIDGSLKVVSISDLPHRRRITRLTTTVKKQKVLLSMKYKSSIALFVSTTERQKDSRKSKKNPKSSNTDGIIRYLFGYLGKVSVTRDESVFDQMRKTKLSNIEQCHKAELVGSMSLYPEESGPIAWIPVLKIFVGKNIAIDTDDLVLANEKTWSLVIGTYGNQTGKLHRLKKHLARRDRYHVSWRNILC